MDKTAAVEKCTLELGIEQLKITPDGDHHHTTTVKRATGYSQSLLERLRNQRADDQEQVSPANAEDASTDMTIRVGGEHVFHVHRCLMVASCDYFDAMTRSGMLESRAQHIELKGVSYQGLCAVIDFVYSGEMRLSLANIGETVRAVSHLQVKHALKLCEDYLIEETTTENAVDMLNLAEMFCIENVRVAVTRFILRNFERLVATNQYKRFSLEQIKVFLQSNKLKLHPELTVFHVCVNWLKHHQEISAISSYELMQYVRFNTMRAEEFVDVVAKCALMKSDVKCCQLLIESFEYFAVPTRQYCSSSLRSQIRNEPAMVCVNECMYILNQREDSWHYLCHSPATNKTLSQKFCVVNNFLYACGGYSEINRETCAKCYRFDPRVGQWHAIACMNEKRQFFTLTSTSECIVAVGGVFGNIGNFYATFPVKYPIEIYSIEKDIWTSVECQLLPILKWPGACVFETSERKQKLFIVGGKLTETLPSHYQQSHQQQQQQQHYSLSQHTYIIDLSTSTSDATTNVEICAPPITTRFNPSVFVLQQSNNIVLFGGEDDKYRLAPCVELYSLDTRQWSEVAVIPVSLSYQCISSTSMLHDKIYYLLEEHDGPSSESYTLKASCIDVTTWQFEQPVYLPHPSTLASKWCSLVFPQEFLEKVKYQQQQPAASATNSTAANADVKSSTNVNRQSTSNSTILSELNSDNSEHDTTPK